MEDLRIRQCSSADLALIREISETTFIETFSDANTKEDMDKYLRENFSTDKLKQELNDPSSLFYLVELGEKAVAYMKLNLDGAQTEKGHKNTLEIQRIYVLDEFKNRRIGGMLIKKTIDIAKSGKLRYIWLGVWEKNIKALEFYDRKGFVKFDTHVFMLGNDIQTDHLMKLELHT